jgi:hypothetical protein
VEGESAAAVRRVDEHVFQRQGDVWVDAAYTTKLSTITVKWGSPAYFELLRLRPSLGRVLALGRKLVVVLGNGRALRIDTSGKESLTQADRRALAGA